MLLLSQRRLDRPEELVACGVVEVPQLEFNERIHVIQARPAAKFIILNAISSFLNTQFLVFNTKFLIFTHLNATSNVLKCGSSVS